MNNTKTGTAEAAGADGGGLIRPSSLVVDPFRTLHLFSWYWGLVVGLTGLNAWWSWADRPSVGVRTIDASIARGRSGDAERALRDLLRRSPDHGDARMELARLLGKRGDYLGCAGQLARVPYWWPSKAEARFLEGQSYRLVDRARDAEAAWEACVADDPLHPIAPRHFHAAARELIAHYVLEGRLVEARRTIWRAYDAAGRTDRPAILVMRMRAELERIAHEEAVARLRRFAAADPGDWEARRALALEEQLTGQEAAADREIAACLAARPADPAVWRTRLEILHRRGDLAGIRAALARLPPSADGDPGVWKYRGLAREWDGDLAGAAEAYGRATRLNPYEPEYLYKLGTVERRLGRPGPATEHSRQSQELRQAYARLRDAYLEYIEISRRSRSGDPAYRAAVERLATLCSRLGWKREADAWRQVVPGD
jgi:tetratricopeptide (TPR) repeat protein